MYASLIYYCFRKQKPKDADKEEGSVSISVSLSFSLCVSCCYFMCDVCQLGTHSHRQHRCPVEYTRKKTAGSWSFLWKGGEISIITTNAILVAKSIESPVKNSTPRPFSRPAADIEGGNISDRLGKIKTSSESWKNRVELSDATNFTVAGRLAATRSPKLPFIKSDTKQSPPMSAFRSVNPPQLGLAKSPSMMVSSVTTSSMLYAPTTPSGGGPIQNGGGGGGPSPVAALAAVGQQLSSQLSQHRAGMDSILMMKRSISVPGVPSFGAYGEAGGDLKSHAAGGSKVSIPKLDDESFGNFFTKVEKTVAATRFSTTTTTTTSSSSSSSAEVVIGDFDTLKVDSQQRLTQKKVVQGPKRRGAMSKNPLKKLAARDDLQTEYTEIKTGWP